jgi:hypothetical protein
MFIVPLPCGKAKKKRPTAAKDYHNLYDVSIGNKARMPV